MIKRKRKNNFIISLSIVISILLIVVLGAYFALDKLLVPRYFSKYGINNMSELVDVLNTMYVIPDESTFITNPHSASDEQSAESKLLDVNFPKLANGKINYSKITEEGFSVITSEDYESDYLYLTDREVSAIMNQILISGVLIPELTQLSCLDTLTMNVKELSIVPYGNNYTIDDENDGTEVYTSAKIKIIINIDMTSARTQMSETLDIPLFLLNMIIPNNVYMTTELNIEKNNENIWTYRDASLSINGKSSKQSEIVLNLLISFIYSTQPDMTIQKLTDEISKMAISCFDVLGDVKFTNSIKINSSYNNGVIVKLTKGITE